MPRSLKKGPFVDLSLAKKTQVAAAKNDRRPIKTWSRRSMILPEMVGLAMNPVDHPHGGGEGKSGQGNPHPVSPWGQPTKGYKTRVRKYTDKFIIKRRDKGVR